MFSPYHQILGQIGFRIFSKGNDSITCDGETAIVKYVTFFSAIVAINVHSYLNIVSMFLYTFTYDNPAGCKNVGSALLVFHDDGCANVSRFSE